MAEDLRAAYKQRFEQTLEPERYEIFALLETLTPDRRAFLKALGGGVLFLVTVRAQDRDVPVRVQVADDGTFRAFTGKMEMGQGVADAADAGVRRRTAACRSSACNSSWATRRCALTMAEPGRA